MKLNNRQALTRLLAEIRTSNQNAGSVGRVNHPPHFEVILQQVLEDEQASELDQLVKDTANRNRRKPRPKWWNGRPVEIPAVWRACQELEHCTKSEHRVKLIACLITISRHLRIKDFAALTRFLNLHTNNRGSARYQPFSQATIQQALYSMLAEGMVTKAQYRNLVCKPRKTRRYKKTAGL